MKKKIILKKITKLKSENKKYEAMFDINGKIVKRKFGASGMSDFTKHKDKNRRENYISRHKKDLKTNDPTRAGFLSMYILWNKPSFSASVADYKKRLNTYNKTGKFSTKITGSKILSFGAILFNETTLEKLPSDIQDRLLEEYYGHKFNTQIKKLTHTENNLLKKFIDHYNKTLNIGKKPILLDSLRPSLRHSGWWFLSIQPDEKESVKLIQRASDILTKENFEKRLWYNFLLYLVEEFQFQDPNNDDYLDDSQKENLNISKKAIIKMLKKIDYDLNEKQNSTIPWYNSAFIWLHKNKRVNEAIIEKNKFGTFPVKGTYFEILPSDVIERYITPQLLIHKFKTIKDSLINLEQEIEAKKLLKTYKSVDYLVRLINILIEFKTVFYAYTKQLSIPEEYKKEIIKELKNIKEEAFDISQKLVDFFDEEYSDIYDSYDWNNDLIKYLKDYLMDNNRHLNTNLLVNEFGTREIFPVKDTYFDILPNELLLKKFKTPYYVEIFKKGLEKRKETPYYLIYLLKKFWKLYDTTQNYGNYMKNKPWIILDPLEGYTANWLLLAADILNSNDFSKGNFWYNCILHVVDEFVRLDPDNSNYDQTIRTNITISEENIEVILEKMGTVIDCDKYQWYKKAYIWLTEEYGTKSSFGKSKIPDNVVNKSLYEKIKNKIKKDVDKKKRRWGAYDSGRLVREYKEKGGKYSGNKDKKKESDLSRWYKEKWIDACVWPKIKSCGRTKESIKSKVTYCRPSKKIDAKTPKLVQDLSKSELKKKCKIKSQNPKKIMRN